MEEYNQHISRMLLGNIHDGVLDTLPQPTMFGGKRMRQYVLPSSSDYTYPSTLAVGEIYPEQRSGGQTLGGSFFKDFSKGFKRGFTSVASPVAHELAHEAIRGAILGAGHSGGGHSGGYLIREPPIRGGKKGFKGFIKDVKSGFKQVAPALKSASKALKLTKVGKEIYKDVLQPVGREALDVFKDAGTDALRQGIYSSVGQPQPMAGEGRRRGRGRPPKNTHFLDEYPEYLGGAGLITNNLGEFHHASTRKMPPALASYSRPTGAGRKPSARGAIVSKVMKAKGLSLPEASKYVKDHGLY
jgi:hypothetical protein